MAVMTGGKYVFLTDDSGVGNSHEEPDISGYTVEKLNDLMVQRDSIVRCGSCHMAARCGESLGTRNGMTGNGLLELVTSGDTLGMPLIVR